MPTGLNTLAADILNGSAYKKIANGTVRLAIEKLVEQLQGYRSQGTAVAAVGLLRELVEEIHLCECGHAAARIAVHAEHAELLLSDPVARTSLKTIRAYLDGFVAAAVPSAHPPQTKQSFVVLCKMIAEAN